MDKYSTVNADCMVIGAGLTGMFAALHMADQGLNVTVVDAKTPQAILNDLEAEILLFPRYSLDALAGLREKSWIGCNHFLEKTADLAWLPPFAQLELVVSKTDLDPARAECEGLRHHGAPVEFVSQSDLGKIDPAINPQLLGAILHHNVAAIESERLYRSLLQACDKENHIDLFWETQALGIEVGRGTAVLRSSQGPREAKRIVLTAGVAALGMVAAIGIQLPVVPEKRFRLIGSPSGSRISQAIAEYKAPGSSMQQDAEESDGGGPDVELSVSLRPDKPTSAGYGKEFVATDQSSDRAAMQTIYRRITRVLPGYGNIHFDRVVSRFEPVITDGIPIAGPAPNVEGLYLTVCPGDNKGSLAPAIGESAARWATTGKPSEQTDALSPKRFPQSAPGGMKKVSD